MIPKAPFKLGRLWDFSLYNNQIETNRDRHRMLATDLKQIWETLMLSGWQPPISESQGNSTYFWDSLLGFLGAEYTNPTDEEEEEGSLWII